MIGAGVHPKDAAALVWPSQATSATEVVVEGCRAATAVADAATATATAATGTLVAINGLKSATTPAPVFAKAPEAPPTVEAGFREKYQPYVIGGATVLAIALVGIGGVVLFRHLSSGKVTDASGVDVPLHLVGNG